MISRVHKTERLAVGARDVDDSDVCCVEPMMTIGPMRATTESLEVVGVWDACKLGRMIQAKLCEHSPITKRVCRRIE